MDTSSLSESLLTLSRNHRWTWSTSAQAILDGLPGADRGRHPVQVVNGLEHDQLEDLLADTQLVDALTSELADLDALVSDRPPHPAVAYFSPEFGITDLVPQYSGGLGILAGDHLKAASDLAIDLCGVGLFYRDGFFRQDVRAGRQLERYESYDARALGCIDTGIVVAVPFPRRDVGARVWRLDVGRVPLLLLDTDIVTNTTSDRAITDRLYSGDRRHRLEQELLLGVGGARALDALGCSVAVHHLNEGHAGFLILELIDQAMGEGLDLTHALARIRAGLVFTTHTPVPAGIDRFEIDLATPYLQPWADRWNMEVDDVLSLGADPDDDPASFNMAALCLKASGRANGVSQLHGAVSRELFATVPGGEAISSVTNGVHARTWVMPRLQAAFDSALGESWANGDPSAWQRVDQLSDDTIRSIRHDGGRDLQQLTADRSGASIDPEALIVGFARRFATYKRANLLLVVADELEALLADADRPVQFVFAGKAHPADNEGKALLAEVVAFSTSPASHGRFIFVPDYDMAVAQAMYAGCDVWLNNPIRPHEASGTSGEKSALNGGLNCSISDGWWDEMADGRNGWTIPTSAADDPAKRDSEEATATLRILNDIIAEYYKHDTAWSSPWIDRIRHNWKSLGPRVTAARMVADYQEQLYRPALEEVSRR